uniref:Ovule protein n=1 Tax=Mesocestoides corti TaxID=53468 RepID=A0A5K3G214_MESCO
CLPPLNPRHPSTHPTPFYLQTPPQKNTRKKKKQSTLHHGTLLDSTAQHSTALIEHVPRKRNVSRLAASALPPPVNQLLPISNPKPLFAACVTLEKH